MFSQLFFQQVDNNIVRTSIQALSAILGGTQSLHTNSKDEALALPSLNSAKTALRTQQIIAYESGVIDHPDPFGGSYVIEQMTEKIFNASTELIKKIDSMVIGSGEGNNTSSALFRKSFDEMEYLIQHFKGKKETVRGLAGLGDLYVSAVGGRNSKMGKYLGKGFSFKNAKKKFMRNDTIEGADLANEIAPYILKKINRKKIPLMTALLNAITKNKKLKVNY